MTTLCTRLLGIFMFVSVFSVSAQAQEAQRSIIKVAGDVYRFQNNFHYSLVVVTDSGVVVVDPINAEASQWLIDNLNTITDQPVTNLVYSHSDADHASGGQVFADSGALVIAQANANVDGYWQQNFRIHLAG